MRTYRIGRVELSLVRRYIKSHVKRSSLPTDTNVVLEAFGDKVIFHGCFGTKVNETISRVLASLLTARFGAAVGVKVDPYRIVFTFPDGKARPELIIQTITDLDTDHILPILKIVMKRTSLFKWRLVHVAKRFGAMRRDVDYQSISLDRLAMAFEETPLFDETLREIMLEKLDVERTREILGGIKSGRIRVEVVQTPKVSPIASSALGSEGFSDIIAPETPLMEIMAILKRRLMAKRVRILCMNCLNSWKARVEELDEHPQCPSCGSRFLASLRPGDTQTQDALTRQREGGRVTPSQKELIDRARLSAELVSEYGRRAIMTMAARGIGPQTAARILQKMHESEEDLLRDVFSQEKLYARTRRFWD